jgi:antitoxin component of RelBE/YafQ-DinJ toxin-antitoxin module
MNATTISFSIDPRVKKKAKEKVEKQGYSLDAFVGIFVSELLTSVAEQESSGTDIVIHLEKPTKYFKQAVKKARADRKAGKASPTFENAEDAIEWLHK